MSVGCSGPLPFMSGGALEGAVEPPPPEWNFGTDYGVFQLETRPQDPYSVNLAYTILNGVFYVYAGDTETEWVRHMEVDPRVRVRHDGRIYELEARRVVEPGENATFAKRWAESSFFHRDPRELQDETWLYRLEPRDRP